MTILVTDRRHVPYDVHSRAWYRGSLLLNSYTGIAGKTIGDYKYTDSIREGKFIKGVYRANPTTIVSGLGSCATGLLDCTSSDQWRYLYEGCFNAHRHIMPIGTWSNQLADISASKAYAKLNGATADLGVMIGELEETLFLLRHPFEALHKYIYNRRKAKDLLSGKRSYRSYKRFYKNYVRGENEIGISADLWLTYRYGIMPLINEISKIIDLFNEKVDVLESVLLCKRAGVSTSSTTVTNISTSWQNIGYISRETRVSTVKSFTHCYFHRLLGAAALYNLRRVGFNPLQIPATLWELTRYSFVVDWFLNVGTWLTAIMPNPEIDFKGACTSQVSEEYFHAEVLYPAKPGYTTWLNQELISPTYEWTSRRLERRVGIAMPAMPTVNPNIFKIKRLLDSLALIWRPLIKFRHRRR